MVSARVRATSAVVSSKKEALHLEARLCQEERFLRRPFLFGRDLDAFGQVEQLIIGLRYLEADLLSQTVAERCGGIRSAGRT